MRIAYLYVCPQFYDLQPTWLSAAERERLAGMRFPPRRQDWLAGRFAAHQLLSALGYATGSIEIANDPLGAPYARQVATGERLPGSLSISHRDGSALCAYTPEPGVAIGADLEKLEPRSAAFCKDYFTEREQAVADGWLEPQRSAWFILLWSLKESCLKVACTGLRLDPLTIEIDVEGFRWPMPGGWKPARGQDLRSGNRFHLAWVGRQETLHTLGWNGDVEDPTLEEIL